MAPMMNFVEMALKVPRHDNVQLLLGGVIKDRACVPPLPRDLVQLRQMISGTFVAVTRDLLI